MYPYAAIFCQMHRLKSRDLMNYLLSLVELLYLCNYINNYHRLYEAKVFFVYSF